MQGCQALPTRGPPTWDESYLPISPTAYKHTASHWKSGSENCLFAQQNLEATATTMATMRAYLTVS